MKFSIERDVLGTKWYEHLDTEKDDMKKWWKQEIWAFIIAIVVFIAVIFVLYLLISLYNPKEKEPEYLIYNKIELNDYDAIKWG